MKKKRFFNRFVIFLDLEKLMFLWLSRFVIFFYDFDFFKNILNNFKIKFEYFYIYWLWVVGFFFG